MLLCHPSRESITVSLRLAARHRKRLAQKGEERRKVERRKIKSITEAGLEEKTWVSGR